MGKWSGSDVKTISNIRNNMGKWKDGFFHFEYPKNGFFQHASKYSPCYIRMIAVIFFLFQPLSHTSQVTERNDQYLTQTN